ncbi:UPF0171 family protein [Sesbania bispinosa]|nr:UPF0171 family protein [Sesbania bispinosa]
MGWRSPPAATPLRNRGVVAGRSCARRRRRMVVDWHEEEARDRDGVFCAVQLGCEGQCATAAAVVRDRAQGRREKGRSLEVAKEGLNRGVRMGVEWCSGARPHRGGRGGRDDVRR